MTLKWIQNIGSDDKKMSITLSNTDNKGNLASHHGRLALSIKQPTGLFIYILPIAWTEGGITANTK